MNDSPAHYHRGRQKRHGPNRHVNTRVIVPESAEQAIRKHNQEADAQRPSIAISGD
jgi:hypothetical protein